MSSARCYLILVNLKLNEIKITTASFSCVII